MNPTEWAVYGVWTALVLAIVVRDVIAWLERRDHRKQVHNLMVRLSARNETEAQMAMNVEKHREAIPPKQIAENENERARSALVLERSFGDDNRFNRGHGRSA